MGENGERARFAHGHELNEPWHDVTGEHDEPPCWHIRVLSCHSCNVGSCNETHGVCIGFQIFFVVRGIEQIWKVWKVLDVGLRS